MLDTIDKPMDGGREILVLGVQRRSTSTNFRPESNSLVVRYTLSDIGNGWLIMRRQLLILLLYSHLHPKLWDWDGKDSILGHNNQIILLRLVSGLTKHLYERRRCWAGSTDPVCVPLFLGDDMMMMYSSSHCSERPDSDAMSIILRGLHCPEKQTPDSRAKPSPEQQRRSGEFTRTCLGPKSLNLDQLGATTIPRWTRFPSYNRTSYTV